MHFRQGFARMEVRLADLLFYFLCTSCARTQILAQKMGIAGSMVSKGTECSWEETFGVAVELVTGNR
jgi:hypothetical protein